MDVQIWENTIVAWVNLFNVSTPIQSSRELNDSIILNIINKIKLNYENGPIEFLKNSFPNLIECNSFALSSSTDYLCAATLLLVYISYSKNTELEGLREIMCTKLDNAVQVNIAEFLMSIQNQEDVFNISFKGIHQEILEFVEKHPVETAIIGDCVNTPVKNIADSSFGSPLQGFFQTPKRSLGSRQSKYSSILCGDGDHLKLIKKLTNQLVEEEMEKTSLQEKLSLHTKKCSEYELKLRNKIEEIKDLKCEWESETKKNEEEIQELKNNILKKLEDEKKLKDELSHLESYVSTLQSDITYTNLEKDKIENQLKTVLHQCSESEAELVEATELNAHLKNVIENKEKDLIELRDNYVAAYKDENAIDVGYLNKTTDSAFDPSENMEVSYIVEKLLRKKNDENDALQKTIDDLNKEKNNLLNDIKSINEQLAIKGSEISELQFLNKELLSKLEKFDSTEQKLFCLQKELVNVNSEITRLLKENSALTERCNALNSNLEQREQALVEFKHSKMFLHINFLKLAEDFRAVQKRLESEIENISRLTSDGDDSFQSYVEFDPSEEYKEAEQYSIQMSQSLEFTKPMERRYLEVAQNNLSVILDIKVEKVNELLQYFENQHLEWSESNNLLKNTCSQLNENVIALRVKINKLLIKEKLSAEEKTELQTNLKEARENMAEIESLYSSEINKLKRELEEKGNEIKKLENVVQESKILQQNLEREKEDLRNQTTKFMKEKFMHQGVGFINTQMSSLFNNIGGMQSGTQSSEVQQDPSDSVEEIPMCNKTFEIVNLEEKHISDKTFSIKKDNEELNEKNELKNSVWIVSPPPKTTKKEVNRNQDKKTAQGASWKFSASNRTKDDKSKKSHQSYNEVCTTKVESNSNLTKSSSLSSILEIDYSPPTKIESKSSDATSFFSFAEGKKDFDENSLISKKRETGHTKIPVQKVKSLEQSAPREYRHCSKTSSVGNHKVDNSEHDRNKIVGLEIKISQLEREITESSKECEQLKASLSDLEQRRKKDKETFEKNQTIIRQNITSKYEGQLEHLKNEMKQLYNRELAKHKSEQSKMNLELKDQNKGYKEHIDELRNHLWEMGEKLLQEQKSKRDLERNYNDLKKKFESVVFYKDRELKNADMFHRKDGAVEENSRMPIGRQATNTVFPLVPIPTEDEDEVFDNRFLEDIKTGISLTEKPESRLTELQYRNSLCLPHLKSSYPAETQFQNPKLFKEHNIKFGSLAVQQETQSLTDSDHSMTKSLLPEDKGKKKEQTSYKRPGPPTPSKNGGRISSQDLDGRLTPKNILKEANEQSDISKNTAPVTPRKKLKIFRKPFGARDY